MRSASFEALRTHKQLGASRPTSRRRPSQPPPDPERPTRRLRQPLPAAEPCSWLASALCLARPSASLAQTPHVYGARKAYKANASPSVILTPVFAPSRVDLSYVRPAMMTYSRYVT